MGDHSAIEWTNASWNPLAGCTRVSAGCDLCYAAALAAGRLKNNPAYKDLAVVTPSGRAAFNGTIRLLPDRLDQPLRWRRPRRIFVNSMSDLFHEGVPDDFLDKVFGVMALAQHHTFQVLTKRPERMRDYSPTADRWDAARQWLRSLLPTRTNGPREYVGHVMANQQWPLRNVWLGVSCENQKTAAERIPILLQTPAAVRWISAEPLLGPIDLRNLVAHHDWDDFDDLDALTGDRTSLVTGPDDINDHTHWPGLNWVVVGGESGPHARPMDLDWARGIRDQCVAAGVCFLFKQVGGRTPKAGGRELDGRTWDAYPRDGGVTCGV